MNCLYNVIITITSSIFYLHYAEIYEFQVGYGDYYPRSIAGRTISVLGCMWGVFVLSWMVVIITNITNLTDNETRVIEFVVVTDKLFLHRR